MMSFEIIIALMAFAFVTSITPGPNNLMLMASGINYGFARSCPHLMGVSIGFFVMIIMVGFGLMNIFDAYPFLYILLKIIGIGYLLFLAWKVATTKPNTAKESDNGNHKPITFFQGALFQWVNPKAWIMIVTAITTYASGSQGLDSVFLIAVIFGIIMIPSIGSWVILGTQLQRFLNHPVKIKWFNRFAATLLILSLYPVLF